MDTNSTSILDVTIIEPRLKHPAIFEHFDLLKAGESFIIHNDHDPKPLYYQMLGERGNIFTWQYLEEGPEWWKVKISKRNNNDEETLGQIASKDLRKVEVFKKYGIDFCCGGKQTLHEACKEKNLDIVQVEKELNAINQTATSRPIPYNDWDAGFLCDYIVNTHHAYVNKTLPDLMTYAAKVAKVHGESHKELAEVFSIVQSINAELKSHMMKEEKILFPYIKELVSSLPSEQAVFSGQLGSVQNPINMMEMEHETVGQSLEQLRLITNNYSIPEDACATYSILYKMLPEFEDDLKMHIHLENNILFPKAISIEKNKQ